MVTGVLLNQRRERMASLFYHRIRLISWLCTLLIIPIMMHSYDHGFLVPASERSRGFGFLLWVVLAVIIVVFGIVTAVKMKYRKDSLANSIIAGSIDKIESIEQRLGTEGPLPREKRLLWAQQLDHQQMFKWTSEDVVGTPLHAQPAPLPCPALP